jgi:hypothetical protein
MAKETEKTGLSRGINKGHVRFFLADEASLQDRPELRVAG